METSSNKVIQLNVKYQTRTICIGTDSVKIPNLDKIFELSRIREFSLINSLNPFTWLNVNPENQEELAHLDCLVLCDLEKALKIRTFFTGKLVLLDVHVPSSLIKALEPVYFVLKEGPSTELKNRNYFRHESYWNLQNRSIILKGPYEMNILYAREELFQNEDNLFQTTLAVTTLFAFQVPIDLIQKLLLPELGGSLERLSEHLKPTY